METGVKKGSLCGVGNKIKDSRVIFMVYQFYIFFY
jgi:hypothetical protein